MIRVIVIWKILVVILFAQNGKGANEFFKANNIDVKALSDSTKIDPYSFFPSQVGGFWQYTCNYLREYKIAKDSLLGDESRYVYEEHWNRPTYQIDTNYNVVFDPMIEPYEILYFLDAQKDERWWVWSYEDSTYFFGEFAVVDTIYEGRFLGKNSIFKVIKYYMVVPDVGDSLVSWDHDVVLASGMGLVYKDIEAESPMVLISAIIDGDTLGTLVNVNDEPKTTTPNDFTLSQNYPNPFNPSTVINYSLPKSGFVDLKVYDMLGREVASLVNKEQSIGNYKIEFNASNLTSGIYFYRISSDGFTKSMKMILLK